MAEETRMQLTLEPAHVQARAIRDGETSSRELLELCIERIEKLDGDINAVVTRDFEAGRREADQADAVLARGDPVRPLHGLPITIKDALETEGMRSTGGAEALTDYLPVRDAAVVRKLKDAGAIVFGKTNLPEWSGDAQAYNELFGTTRNPWNLKRVPGGSSGGAAAAVATGMTSFEIGTDIGGSVRFPAAFCGVFGHKPSFGIVPSTGYLDHAEGGTTEADVNVIGPIARSGEDLELLLPLLLKDTSPWEVRLPEPTDVAALRVAAWLDDPVCPRQPDKFLSAPGITPRPTDIQMNEREGVGTMRVVITMDPPEHRKVRAVASPWFTPHALRAIDAAVEQSARELVDELAGDTGEGETDLAMGMAVSHPLRILSTALGVPREHEPKILELSNRLFAPEDEELGRGMTTPDDFRRLGQEFLELFLPIVQDRRANPTSDLASVLANGLIDGQPMGPAETLGYYLIVFSAGHVQPRHG